ncbi:S8 family serine peptidase [Catenulispora rubra]|uniref:S8 family serine peptidase n=1 Tax=Catenulispora rubra TaxID=280293 RepID=UPI0018922995|nr:S8 family serine peptidase [Catenulispora rubra]
MLRRVSALAAAAMLPVLIAAPAARADQVRSAQWPITFLNLPQAWKTTKGAGITVAVLDTGVVGTRADLTGQVTTGPDLVGGSEKPGDPDWGVHGTGMASVIAGHGHGPGGGEGVMGVAPAAKILSVRVIRDDESPDRGLLQASHTPISEGIKYAVDHGAQVISMSLGGTVPGADSDTTNEAGAVRYAIAHGVSVVVSAGNSGEKPEKDVTEYPAGERGVIGVAAVDERGRRAFFSSTGWDVAVAAPGVDIPMALPINDTVGNTYADFGPEIGPDILVGAGTSPACAYVAGVVALIRSANPALSPEQVAQIVKDTASHRPAGGRDDQLGSGIVDPVAALRAAAGVAGQPATPKAPAYQGSKYFGFGPEVVADQTIGGLSTRQRGMVDAAVAFSGSLVLGGWLAVRGRRRVRVARIAGMAGLAGMAGAVGGPGVPVTAWAATKIEPMTDFAGRTLAPSAFPTDDGTADPALLAVLEAHGRGEAAIEHAYGYLLNARVLAPIVAVLGEAEEVPDEQGRNLRRDKNSDMALVTLVAPDGTRALPVFTSVEALVTWNPEARPMPVAFPRACAAAKTEGAEVVLVDLARPSFLEVEPAAVRAFAAVLEKQGEAGGTGEGSAASTADEANGAAANGAAGNAENAEAAEASDAAETAEEAS